MSHRWTGGRAAVVVALVLAAAAPLGAQQTPPDTARDDLEEIRRAAREAAGAAQDTTRETDREFTGRQRALQALNPEITVTGDLLAVVDVDEAGENAFIPKEFEFSFISALDPYSRAKVFVGAHEPGGELAPFGEEHAEEEEHGAGLGVEEGYLEWVNLPGGFSVALGKLRQRFGTLNRWHAHALPTAQYPLPYLAFFGEEGLAQTGLSVHWLAPTRGTSAFELWLEPMRSSNEVLFAEARGLSALAHLNAFFELTPATYFEVGLTGLAGPFPEEAGTSRVGGLDFTFSWRPPERALYREFTLRGGAVVGELGASALGAQAAYGAFVLAEYRLGRRWLIGGRYEWTQDPHTPADEAWVAGPTLTWWQSEFVRLRAQLDHLQRPGDSLTRLLIQTTLAMGPHKHETY